ncbi:hypothetical protein ACSRUE_16960 [Sorangium sp. KYC3313]|uniref:hypothetical protein n=1 Tax=Sorangium sp. KYC3313 TaxID=3449740 RepID=UPI003F8AAF17
MFAGVRDLRGRTVGELRELGVTPVVIDVTDDVAVERGVTQALAAGPLDALVNNAAIFLHATVEARSHSRPSKR